MQPCGTFDDTYERGVAIILLHSPALLASISWRPPGYAKLDHSNQHYSHLGLRA